MRIEQLVNSNFFGKVAAINELAKNYGLLNLQIIPPISFTNAESLNLMFEPNPGCHPSIDELVNFLIEIEKLLDPCKIQMHNTDLLNEELQRGRFNRDVISNALLSAIPLGALEQNETLDKQFSRRKMQGLANTNASPGSSLEKTCLSKPNAEGNKSEAPLILQFTSSKDEQLTSNNSRKRKVNDLESTTDQEIDALTQTPPIAVRVASAASTLITPSFSFAQQSLQELGLIGKRKADELMAHPDFRDFFNTANMDALNIFIDTVEKLCINARRQRMI